MIRRALLTVAVLGVPRVVLACPVCFGQSDSPLANATNLGIIAMLVVVVAVLSGFAAFIVYLNRRARLFAAEGAGPAQAGRSALTTTTPQEGTAQC